MTPEPWDCGLIYLDRETRWSKPTRCCQCLGYTDCLTAVTWLCSHLKSKECLSLVMCRYGFLNSTKCSTRTILLVERGLLWTFLFCFGPRATSPCSLCSLLEFFSAGSHLRWGVRMRCVCVSVFLEGEGSRCFPPLHQLQMCVLFSFFYEESFSQATPHLCLVRSRQTMTITLASSRSINNHLQQKLIMSLKVLVAGVDRFWKTTCYIMHMLMFLLLLYHQALDVFGLILLFCISPQHPVNPVQMRRSCWLCAPVTLVRQVTSLNVFDNHLV